MKTFTITCCQFEPFGYCWPRTEVPKTPIYAAYEHPPIIYTGAIGPAVRVGGSPELDVSTRAHRARTWDIITDVARRLDWRNIYARFPQNRLLLGGQAYAAAISRPIVGVSPRPVQGETGSLFEYRYLRYLLYRSPSVRLQFEEPPGEVRRVRNRPRISPCPIMR